MLYTHGQPTDQAVMRGDLDLIHKGIEMGRKEGVPVGIGAHLLEVVIASEKHKLNPDFYVKTFHVDRYWSATPKENRDEFCWYKSSDALNHDGFCDNIWCMDAEKTVAVMESVDKPWVAFKVMAAGAIHPHMAFSYAYRNGADFIIAGMFDFQVEADVKFAIDSLQKLGNRKRPWRG